MREGFYLVCYDVVDDRRRNRVVKVLKGFGVRVQKSVFECVLTEEQLDYVEMLVMRCLKLEEDQVRFYPMSGHTRRKIKILGVQPEMEVDDELFIV